jgi:hypothetical protein
MSTAKKNLIPGAWVDLGTSPVTLTLTDANPVLVYIGQTMPDATSRDGLTLDNRLPNLPVNFPGQKVFAKAKFAPTTIIAFTTDTVASDVPMPGPVDEFRAVSITTKSVALAWKPPKRGGTPAGYKVEYRRSSGSSPWTTFVASTSDVNCTVTGLAEGTTYRFRVTALNTSGKGPISQTVYMQTANTPIEQPVNDNVLKNVDGTVLLNVDGTPLLKVA